METDMTNASREVPPATLEAVIIGTGFGGIGMAVAFQKAGMNDFVILEKAADVGGVWRDNTYPGAACDVPSHLYSFSFEPNPDWSGTFARQDEIHDYLRHCVRKYALEPKIRFNAEVAEAAYDEGRQLWRVTLADGTSLSARLLISAAGQLSRPVIPRLEGSASFKGQAFHSANWDHSCDLSGKRVAVVGTGASATQFVPAIADRVGRLLVFQRTPAYILPRAHRLYTSREQSLFRRVPLAMRLHRAFIYVRYESRALAFTRAKSLLKLAVGIPFRHMLQRQVADPGLRLALTPGYPIGCKRILLSSDYLASLSKPNVTLVSTPVRRLLDNGIETADGERHQVDVLIYGTGFGATGFLSPMRITGRAGLDLNGAWRDGAQAYLGMTVPGFPNFFMLYGPNTNLGHNSIVYMIESQVAHVMRCWRAMKRAAASAIDVDAARYRGFNHGIQRRLAESVWNGCTSWYVDANGHNSTNWPGFTLSYRWLTRFSSLQAYSFTRPLPGLADGVVVAEPQDGVEKLNAGFLRLFLRTCFRPLVGPPWGPSVQRRVARVLAPLMPGVGGTSRFRTTARGVPTEVLTPAQEQGGGAILYLHGGAFCLGNAAVYRSITTRLAVESGMPVWVPDYRLAPEHPYPAALDDVLACYEALLERGYEAAKTVVIADSAGAALALALALRLRDAGRPAPAGLALISPVADPTLGGATMQAAAGADPMVRKGWLEQGLGWYGCPATVAVHRPLQADLQGLPPIFIQAGDQEILLSDSTRLAEHAASCGVPCRIEIHARRWHVFHLEAFYLRSAASALRALAGFARARVAEAQPVRTSVPQVSPTVPVAGDEVLSH
jgi:cation diffusion facilitator CzcD-associated flavoprotein CzcO/acetyl esterase/lipase